MEDSHVASAEPNSPVAPDSCLRNGGEMGARMRAFDWARTPLGCVEQWPQSLKTTVQILLNSRYPIFVWWGRELTNLYNDAYAPMLGRRHPHALGQSAPQVWADVWPVVGPQAAAVLHGGRASWNEELLLIMERYGYPEETYFTFSYSPVADETGGVGGVFCAVTEDTTRVLGQRRLRTLRELGTATVGAKDADEACRLAATALGTNPYDLPFVLLYLFDAQGTSARLVGAAGIQAGAPGAPLVIDLQRTADGPWRLEPIIASGAPVDIDDLQRQVGVMPGGPWPTSPSQAIGWPLAQAGQAQLAGILIAGVNPFHPPDEEYRGFLGLVANSVATAIADARAHEAERQRAEVLAELDRAKTTFFSNISHEFRTPLTLMLGPLEDMLAQPAAALGPEGHAQLETIHRNGLRLLKLVNTLLDFARLQAGRIEASYELTDLATVTADLASVFRSAIERAGLRLQVDCPPLPEPVYVDREMWEKIILNLLSNALKFTFEGEIAVCLGWNGTHAELVVRDTGTGIPPHELPHIFERFHRVRDARARTHEGTGIGLALVQELVQLHGGRVSVESAVGLGTTFTVSILAGAAHLPTDRVGAARHLASTALGAEAFFEEALRWLPTEPSGVGAVAAHAARPVSSRSLTLAAARILVADDNADMRAYLQRLLSPQWQVETVADGEQALAVVGMRRPDLVLADIMMPRLDGLALLRALRAHPSTATVPVILLSARTGEEAQVEGLAAGADDYLVKPFVARELLARVEAHLKLARLRDEMQAVVRESEGRFRSMADNAPVMIWLAEPDATCTYLNRAWYTFTGQTPATGLGFGWIEAVHPDDREYVRHAFVTANTKGEAFRLEYRLRRHDGEYRWVINTAAPRSGPHGEFLGCIGSVIDITERQQAEVALRGMNATLEQRVAERTAALERAMTERQRLEREAQKAERFALLGRLAAGVSHELRNPLGAVFLHVDLLAEELAQPSPDNATVLAESVDQIKTNLARVEDLMQDYLSLARVSGLRREVQDLGAALQVWAGDFQNEATARGMCLEVEGLADLGAVAFHSNTLRRALLNLLHNALDAMPHGGTVTLCGQGTPSQVWLQVCDTGSGILPEQLAQIFAPLYTTKPGGTGLGLYIVQEVVAAHSGQVTVESVVGQGTTFTIVLPREDAAPSPPEAHAPAANRIGEAWGA